MTYGINGKNKSNPGNEEKQIFFHQPLTDTQNLKLWIPRKKRPLQNFRFIVVTSDSFALSHLHAGIYSKPCLDAHLIIDERTNFFNINNFWTLSVSYRVISIPGIRTGTLLAYHIRFNGIGTTSKWDRTLILIGFNFTGSCFQLPSGEPGLKEDTASKERNHQTMRWLQL